MPMLDPETQAYLDRLAPQAAAQRARTLAPYGGAASARGYNTHREYQTYQDAKGRRDFLKHVVLPVGIAAGGAALPFVMGGGGAAASGAGGAAASGGAASAAGGVAGATGRFTLGNMLRMAEVGVPAITSFLGMRSQNRAMDRQAAMEQQTLADQMAFAREQLAHQTRESDRVAQEDQRRWDIDQANRARELAAAEEERAFNRRLIEEREARRAQARMRLSEFLARGR